MSEPLKIASEKDFLLFDPSEKLFSTSFYSFPLEGAFFCSEGKPWRLEAPEICISGQGLRDGGLYVDCRCSLCDFSLFFFFDEAGLLEGKLEVTARKTLTDFSFGLAFPVPDESRLTMPMSLYNGNPSTAPDRCVPRFSAEGKASLVLEESRFPIPGVNAEFGTTSFSCFLRPGKGGTLGAERLEQGRTFCLLMSGCVAFNGEHDMAYEFKCRAVHHPKGYKELPMGETAGFGFALYAGETELPGEGFRDLVRKGWQLLSPEPHPVLSLDEMISRKADDLENSAWEGGYTCVHPDNLYKRTPYFLFGWAGQYCRLALCDIRYGHLFNEPGRIRRGLEAVDFFLRNGETATPGLYHTIYYPKKKQWRGGECQDGCVPARAMGESFSDIVRIMLFCKKNGISYPEYFEEKVFRAFEFMTSHLLPCGVTPMLWQFDGTPDGDKAASAGTSVISGLLSLYELTGKKSCLEQGLSLLESYWKLGGCSYDTPFACATLDAGCEDKEAAIPFFTAAAQAWYLTKEERFRHMASSSGDWLLTWVYFWSVPLKEGSICRHFGFDSVGWPSVSVENQHLDVFFPAWEMYLFGSKSGDRLLEKAGELVFKAWSHGISAGNGHWLMPRRGMQAEQFYQTDWCFSDVNSFGDFPEYFQKQLAPFGYDQPEAYKLKWCGGCNPWQVSWIIALVLDAALSFKENA